MRKKHQKVVAGGRGKASLRFLKEEGRVFFKKEGRVG